MALNCNALLDQSNRYKGLSSTSLTSLCAMLLLLPLSVLGHGSNHGSHSGGSDDLSANHDLGIEIENLQPVLSADIIAPAPAPALKPSVGGQWSAVYDWPLVAIHAALLPNGNVLAWDATPDDADDDPHTTDNFTTRVTLWDPISNTHRATNNDTDTDLFCAGSAHLWDGRILFAGGDSGRDGANGPLSNSNIYNPLTNTWHRTEDMNAPRWYSSVATLANGEMLTFGGSYYPNPVGEVFQFNQTWRPLSGGLPIEISGDYQWLQQTPEGSVIFFGPENLVADIETDGAGRYTPLSTRDNLALRDYGSYAMYDVGKILVSGGADGQKSAIVIDTASRQVRDTTPMSIGRRQHNLTILADGSVLSSGGNSDGTRYFSPTAGVFTPELWDPATEQWTELNPMQADRQYHSIALLLKDGRVLSAGGGICGDCYAAGYEERNGEVYSPPYLFNEDGTLSDRPQLAAVPSQVNYAQRISLNINTEGSIEKAHLIKLGSVTHSENQDQRLVPLSFQASSNSISFTMPADRAVAPPGHYLLFVVNSNGVPSTGSIVKLGQPLLKAGQQVVNTHEINQVDVYETVATTGTVNVSLSAASALTLHISANAPSNNNPPQTTLCQQVTNTNGVASCELAVGSGSVLYIGVSGNNRVDYTLNFNDDGVAIADAPVITATTGSGSPGVKTSTGFGALGWFSMWVLLLVPVVRLFKW
jgi:hypothetical protein